MTGEILRFSFFHGEFPLKVGLQVGHNVIAGPSPHSEIRKTLTLHGSGTHATGPRCFHPPPCLPRLALCRSALLDNIILRDAIKIYSQVI